MESFLFGTPSGYRSKPWIDTGCGGEVVVDRITV
jgi:hypothetical protein